MDKQQLADGITKDAVKAALVLVKVLADAVKEAGEIPSGALYAAVMSKIDLNTYNRVLDILQKAGVIEVKGNLVKWIVKP